MPARHDDSPLPTLDALSLTGEPLVLRDGPDALVVHDPAAGRVLHLPKHDAALAAHERRVQILPYLRGHLSAAIPQPQPHSLPSASRGAFESHWLPGSAFAPALISERSEARLAKTLAQFLVELHAYPAQRAQALGAIGPRDWRVMLDGLRRRSTTALRPQLGITRAARLRRWWQAFLDAMGTDGAGDFQPAPTHGNLAPEHLLVDDEARGLEAVLGWNRLAVTDPALDLAAVSEQYGANFAWLVTEAYQQAGGVIDVAFLNRARRHAGILPFLDWDRSRAPGQPASPPETARLLERLLAGPISDPR
ncbi:MAG: putative kinase, aminoglycoside phosphotransferase (APT) family [Chloroflexi bacterium]|nr:MAG: putative kinase, aminoglycoside phosphotransferase (APT) family [Chloroflexota bacterium]